MNIVEVLFSDRAINRGGILLLSKKDALDFIKQCKYHKIVILGIDGFFISESCTQPSLEDSIDYSSALFNNDTYEKALEFINKRDANLYFEIICE